MKGHYSALDRAFYRMVFNNPQLQRDLAGTEDRIFAQRLSKTKAAAPVFVTSLPRAGTTLLLNTLVQSGSFSSHTYRDMPLPLSPLLWASMTKKLHLRAVAQERRHGDGVTINLDAAEAMDEVAWMLFWKRKYRGHGIEIWSQNERSSAFESFYARHMRKVVALRGAPRYLSKNNANVSRLGLLHAAFPDSQVVVPFRRPLEQAGSLLDQHRRFLNIHVEEPFTKQYMAWLGHFEFGALHRPILFPGFRLDKHDIGGLNYWISYWIACFQHLLDDVSPKYFVSYEHLCSRPHETLKSLGAKLRLENPALEKFAHDIRAPRLAAAADHDPSLLQEAERVYDRLIQRCI